MANDHYISEFHTKPWEVKKRLHFYDFESGAFGDCRAEWLFAKDGLHSERTGRLLNKLVENPVNRFRKEIVRRGAIPEFSQDWKLVRALVAFILLQGQRDLDARKPGQAPVSLDDMLAHGERHFDALAGIALKGLEPICVTLPRQSLSLFFTEAVYFPIPMTGTAPILAVPLTPRHFVALPEKGFSSQQLKGWLAKPAVMSAFSMGVGRSASKVVIPPGSLEAMRADPKAFETMLLKQQVNCRDVFNAIGWANEVVGLRSFTISDAEADGTT